MKTKRSFLPSVSILATASFLCVSCTTHVVTDVAPIPVTTVQPIVKTKAVPAVVSTEVSPDISANTRKSTTTTYQR